MAISEHEIHISLVNFSFKNFIDHAGKVIYEEKYGLLKIWDLLVLIMKIIFF